MSEPTGLAPRRFALVQREGAGMDTRTVTGTWLKPDGTPASGTVRFVSSNPVRFTGGSEMLAVISEVATLDANGSISVALPVTDAGSPSGWYWLVEDRLLGAANNDYGFLLPAGEPVDIADLTLVADPTVPAGEAYVVEGTAPVLSAVNFTNLPTDLGGPEVSTDNAFARWDGADGETIQDSQTTEDDSGNLTVTGRINQVHITSDGTSTGIGPNVLAAGDYGVAVGNTANASAVNAIALGRGVTASHVGSVAVGRDSGGTPAATSAADEIVLGTANHTVNIPGGLVVDGETIDDVVSGPASSTDNALARFDGTTGKTLEEVPTNALFVDAANRVGMGTSNPSTRLHVKENADTNTEVRVEAYSNSRQSAITFATGGIERFGMRLPTSSSDVHFVSSSSGGRNAGFQFYNGASLLLDVGHDGVVTVPGDLGVDGEINDASLRIDSDDNLILGDTSAGGSITGSSGNSTIIGVGAAANATSSVQNIVIGRSAAPTLTAGDYNTLLGGGVDVSSGSVANAVALGRSATVNNNATALGAGAEATGAGSVAIGRDSTGSAASTSADDEIKLGTANHTVNVPGALTVDGDNVPTTLISKDDKLAYWSGSQLAYDNKIERVSGSRLSAVSFKFYDAGVLQLAGTGSPEGVHSAPVGSTYVRTDGDTLGDVEYVKMSGSGNTGWVPGPACDTGVREVKADLLTANGFTSATYLRLRRRGLICQLSAVGLSRASAGAGVFYTLPVGFRAVGGQPSYGRSYNNGPYYLSNADAYVSMSGTVDNLSVTWLTNDAAWPTTLPGTAA